MQLSELQLRAEIKCPKGKAREYTLVNLKTVPSPPRKRLPCWRCDDGCEEGHRARIRSGRCAYGVNTLQNDIDYAAMNGSPAPTTTE